MNRFLTAALLFLLGSSLAFSQGETVTIYMKSRQIMTAKITAFDESSLSFSVPGATTSAQILYSQIETIAWPESAVWKESVAAFEERNFEKAVPLLQRFLSAPRNITKFPTPGNFATRARRMLIEAHCDQMDGAAVARDLAILKQQLELLPPNERKLRPASEAWSAFAKKNYTGVLALEKENPTDAEIAYLAGLSYKEKGRPETANEAFTKATVLEAGGNFKIASEALRESILIAPTSGNVHIWATVYGNGNLWDSAPESLLSLLKKPISMGTSVLGEREATEDVDDFDNPEEKAKRVK